MRGVFEKCVFHLPLTCMGLFYCMRCFHDITGSYCYLLYELWGSLEYGIRVIPPLKCPWGPMVAGMLAIRFGVPSLFWGGGAILALS